MLFQEVVRKRKRQSTANKINNNSGHSGEPARKKTVSKTFNISPIKAYNLNKKIVFKKISNPLKHIHFIKKKGNKDLSIIYTEVIEEHKKCLTALTKLKSKY